ncbi:MAG: thiolase family protein [Pseudomonadota bacterium]|nr:thiolase family protein [Pseudomonadota bacterium]MEC8619529.1 thiolase family protein [Pseudomonadota bacterium]
MSELVYVLGAARTPIGSFQGALAKQSAPALGAHAIQGALANAGVAAGEVNEVIMGNVVSAGLKQAPARQAMRMADMPDAVGATTLNKVCGSGMKATMMAMDLIAAGSADTVIAGGMESMSNAPYLLPKARAGLRMGHASMQDSLFTDGLEDAETGGSMGSFAQSTADSHQLTRESMDAYAIESVKRALAAIEQDRLAAEILPMDIDGVSVKDDEQPGKAKVDRISTLRPAFKSDGTITAANASSISDGASALVLTRESNLNGRAPLACIVAHTTHSIHPSEFTLAPIGAIEKLLKKTGWSADSVDLFEINEAFAMVTMLTMQALNLPHEKVNIYGGACAQGHPIGSTGSRLIVTLAHALQQHDKQRGIAALCIGGGEATAVALERA